MKNLKSYLKSAKFKVSEKYKLKYFGQLEKIFIFFIFIFHFQIFSKFLNLEILPLGRGITFIYMFFPWKAIYKNVPTANFFETEFNTKTVYCLLFFFLQTLRRIPRSLQSQPLIKGDYTLKWDHLSAVECPLV